VKRRNKINHSIFPTIFVESTQYEKRSKEINAELNIESGEGIGTSIELKLKI